MSAKKQISFTLSVPLLNPHTIMDTIGVIGANAAMYRHAEKIVFTITTISVSWISFIALGLIRKLVENIDQEGKFILVLNKVSSIIIIAVALLIAKNIVEII